MNISTFFVTTYEEWDRDEDERLYEGVSYPTYDHNEELQLLEACVTKPDNEHCDAESDRAFVPDPDERIRFEREYREEVLARRREEMSAPDTELRAWRMSRGALSRRIEKLERDIDALLRRRADLRREAASTSPEAFILHGDLYSKGNA